MAGIQTIQLRYPQQKRNKGGPVHSFHSFTFTFLPSVTYKSKVHCWSVTPNAARKHEPPRLTDRSHPGRPADLVQRGVFAAAVCGRRGLAVSCPQWGESTGFGTACLGNDRKENGPVYPFGPGISPFKINIRMEVRKRWFNNYRHPPPKEIYGTLVKCAKVAQEVHQKFCSFFFRQAKNKPR